MDTYPMICASHVNEWRAGALHLAVPVREHDHILGAPDAPVTLVQYGDYECVTCLDAEPMVKALLGRYGRRLAFVFRHFPQSSMRPEASLAAQAAEAAGVQGKFWEMHDLLFRNRTNLTEVEITHLGLTIGLEVYRFGAELARGEHEERVRADFLGGVQSGVNQTPTFFINGLRVAGLRSFNALSGAVERELRIYA